MPRSRGLVLRVFVLSATACGLTVMPAAQVAPAAAGVRQARLAAASATGRPGMLMGVSADSANDVWAVGCSESDPPNDIESTLTMHWNGSTWAQVPSPDPGQAIDLRCLNGVSVLSPTSAWAVGDFVNSKGRMSTLILHWNGKRWWRMASPSPGGGDDELTSVSAVSATNVWAVGDYSGSTTAKDLILHWNGSTWSQVPSPSPGGSTVGDQLRGVSADSASDAWAVGFSQSHTNVEHTIALHWNGSTWSQAPSPTPAGADEVELGSVSATSPSNAWAVGFYGAPLNVQTLILRWNGATWTQIASPSPGPSGKLFDGLYGVYAASATNAWAVGDYCAYDCGSTDLVRKTFMLHWNGTKWSHVPSPTPVPSTAAVPGLNGVTIPGKTAAGSWAVGDYCGNGACVDHHTIALRWNGSAWVTG